MRSLTNLLFRLRALLGWKRMQRELDEEVAFHLEMETRKYIGSGMSEEEARRRALRAFGGVEAQKQGARDAWGVRLLHDAVTDVRQTIRQLRKSPSFTAVAVLTLALGIGGASAIFSVVNGVLLRPLPYDDADALVGIWHTAPGVGLDVLSNSPGTYLTYRAESRAFEDVGVWTRTQVTVTGLAEPERVSALLLSDGVLSLLRVQPRLGRLFSADDDAPGGPRTIILGHGYWQRRFDGDPGAIGRTLRVNGNEWEIIGVLPERFRLLDTDASLYMPLRLNPASAITGGGFGFRALARLRPGVELAESEQDLLRMLPIAVERYGGITPAQVEEIGLRPTVHPLKEDVVGDVGKVLWVLLGTVGLVLLIACANVANLLLVRTETRQREVAVRTSLGASPGRIARQLLVESVLLGVIGGAAGLGLAYVGLDVLRGLGSVDLPRIEEIAIDSAALAVTAGVAILTGLAFGLLPVLHHRRSNLVPVLKEGGRGGGQGPGSHRLRNALAVGEVALALVLMIGSGLMVRSFRALRNVEPGFQRPEEVLTVELSIPGAEAAEPAEVARVEEEILRRIAAIPGVVSVGASSSMALTGGGTWTTYVEDSEMGEAQVPPSRRYKFIGGDYFATLQNPVIAGRPLGWSDVHDRATVVVVTENFARQYWDEPFRALGKRIRNNTHEPWREIVGVVGNVHDDGVNFEPPPVVYWPLAVENFDSHDLFVPRTLDFAIRVAGSGTEIGQAGTDPMALLPRIREAVWSVNPNLPLADVRTLEEILADSVARTSFTLVMLVIAAAVALTLGTVGVFGVISYVVGQRTREFGVRIAVGAGGGEIRRLVLRQGGTLGVVGVAIGVVAAVVLTRLMSALLFGVSPLDAPTYAVVSLGVVAVVALASYVPARRAAGVDPAETLRWE